MDPENTCQKWEAWKKFEELEENLHKKMDQARGLWHNQRSITQSFFKYIRTKRKLKTGTKRKWYPMPNQLGYSFKSSSLQWLHKEVQSMYDKEINDSKDRSLFPI